MQKYFYNNYVIYIVLLVHIECYQVIDKTWKIKLLIGPIGKISDPYSKAFS